jgi:coenzyme F420-reducing hydrogenase delta subunit
MTEAQHRVVIFVCNWNAFEGLEGAAKQGLQLPAAARVLKVDCLGQIGASVILKAFEKGADGVMLVGCSVEECHYEFGSRRAADLFDEAQRLAQLLGFREEQMEFHLVHTGEGEALIEKVQAFVDRVASTGAGQGATPS